MDSKPALQTSSTVNPIDISVTEKATHVYVKNENTVGLQPKFCGPYVITSRPSRSVVEVRVGSFANGQARLQRFHWSHCKIAHLRQDAKPVERPGPGRPNTSSLPKPPTTTDAQSVESSVNKRGNNSTGRPEAGNSNTSTNSDVVSSVPVANPKSQPRGILIE